MEKHMIAQPQDYSLLLKEFKLNPRTSPLYWHCGYPGTAQGWIIHISILPHQLANFLKKALPELRDSKLPFKVIKSKGHLIDINNGHYGAERIGKAVTIYTDNEVAGQSLVPNLIALASAFEGPYVLTDFPLGGNVYTRYGAFVDNPRIDDFGRSVNLIRDS